MFENIKKWWNAPLVEPTITSGGHRPKPSTEGSNTPPNQGSGADKKPPKKKELSPKEKATAAGEPYISILSVDLDPNDINNGSFELDWEIVDNIVVGQLLDTWETLKQDLGAGKNVFVWGVQEEDDAEIQKHIDALELLLKWYATPEQLKDMGLKDA